MAPKAFRLGDFIVEPGADRLIHVASGARHELEPKTMAVLMLLAQRYGEVVSSGELIRDVWRDRPMGDNPVYKAVNKLRHALDDGAAEPRYIETIPRKGYRLLIEPEWLDRPAHESDGPVPGQNEPVAPESAAVATGSRRSPRKRAMLVGGIGLGFVLCLAALALRGGGPAGDTGTSVDTTILMQLPGSIRPLYLQARSELRERRPGFAGRLQSDAEELIRAAPGFAPGHALRAMACVLAVAPATERPLEYPGAGGGGAERALACARPSVERALELEPDLAEARAAAGLVALLTYLHCDVGCDRITQLDAAQSSLEEAVRLDPKLSEAHGWLARAFAERGDLVAAAEHAEAAVAFDPLNPVAVCDAGDYLMARGEFALAYDRLLALAALPDVPAYVYAHLADAALANGRPDEALRWTRMLEHGWSARAVRIRAAQLFVRLDHRGDARRAWKTAGGIGTLDGPDTRWAALTTILALDGTTAAASYLGVQTALRGAATLTTDADEQRDWLQFEGVAKALSGRYREAVTSFEEVFGGTGAPRMRLARAASEADRANTMAWAYAKLGNDVRGREVAEGTIAVLDHYATLGFDRAPGFMITRALSYELAGEYMRGRAELERAASVGGISHDELSHDPRWLELQGQRSIALAGTDHR